MKALTNTYLVRGLNRSELIKRLKNGGIDPVRIKIIGDNLTEITIDGKDSAKYFAICKNMWYNVLLKRGGWLYPLVYLKQNAFKAICIIALFVSVIAFDGLYLGNLYEGDACLYRVETERAVASAGIKKYSFFSADDLSRIAAILAVNENISFISVKKCGNKAVFYIKELKAEPDLFPYSSGDVLACDDCEIINIVTYSGTALKKSGEIVLAGEPIVGAYYEQDGERVPCMAVCSYSAKFKFYYEYEPAELSESSVSDAIVLAKQDLGEKTVLNVTHEVRANKITVCLQYERSFICDKEREYGF